MHANSYIRVRWIHKFADEPVELWSELDQQRFEVRKIEVWRNGSVGFASRERRSNNALLGTAPVPPLDEIAADLEFEPEEISKKDFESFWISKVG